MMTEPFSFDPHHQDFPANRDAVIAQKYQHMRRIYLVAMGSGLFSIGVYVFLLVDMEGELSFLYLLNYVLIGFLLINLLLSPFVFRYSMRRRVALYEEGQLLEDEVIKIRHTSTKDIFKVKYTFVSPTGKKHIKSTTWRNTQREIPADGASVRVLYKSDHHFILL